MTTKIAEFLSPQAVIWEMSAQNKLEALRELSQSLGNSTPPLDVEKLYQVLLEREKLNSTGVGEGVAIPHGKIPGLPQLRATFGVCRKGIDFGAIDEKPTHLFFALLAPENSAGIHLKALARISRLFKNPRFRQAILESKSAAEIYQLIAAEDARA